ncbi:MAG: hypothetical protein FJ125_16645, partial [Deltaproteobacteria bacterium]|nr:hypothetical protein [Deltaproteobacteria bacterium]
MPRSPKKSEQAISEAELIELFLGTELLRDLPEAVLGNLARSKAELREQEPGSAVLHLTPGRREKSPLVITISGVLRLSVVPQ